jgi:hypothetical protein
MSGQVGEKAFKPFARIKYQMVTMVAKKESRQSSKEIPKHVLADATAFLDSKYTMNDAYAALGMQLEAVEATEKPMHIEAWMKESIDTTRMKVDFADKARGFLAKYWENIQKNACAWWKDNKEKTGDKLVAGLTPIVAGIIPQPWGAIVGIVVLIVVILIKAGLDTVCAGKAQLPK